MAAKITEDILNERLDIIKKNKNIELVGELKPGKDRSLFKCLSCGYEFNSTLWMMYKGPQGCGRCSGKVLTKQDITDRLNNLRDRGIMFDDVYTHISSRYNFKCLKCDYTWRTTIAHVHLSKTGCGRCNKVRLSGQDIKDKISEIKTRGIDLVSPYTKVRDKHTFYCNNHKITWTTNFSNISRGKGCIECGKEKISKKVSISASKLETKILKLNEKGIYLAGIYTKFSEVHYFVCIKHNEPFNFLIEFNKLKGCPKCAGRMKTDKEIEDTKALNIIRTHLHSQYLKGRIISRSSRTLITNQLTDYWSKQWSKIPPKPGKGYSLDHIIPMSKFDPNDLSSMMDCWDYRNFQWLKSSENSSKSNKLMPEYFTDWHYEILDKMGIKIPI